MAATVHVVARFLAKPGKENDLKAILIALVAPSRREVDCYQYRSTRQSDRSPRFLLR